MSQSKSGEPDLDKVDSFLDSYTNKMGLSGIVEQDVGKYLNYSEEDLKKASPDECYYASFILKKESLYVQSQINKINAQLTWARSRINAIISPELSSYASRGVSFDTQRNLAIKNNAAAQSLHNNVVKKNELCLERLQYIPKQLNDIADIFIKYAYHKIEVNKDGKKNNNTE